mmetsp:Transcript_4419/g.9577  ORF Transcript_4419/g.9577 Transcript_4419/m.9577 type:complete len:417 (+) Transcript_4419:564-1814(+)
MGGRSSGDIVRSASSSKHNKNSRLAGWLIGWLLAAAAARGVHLDPELSVRAAITSVMQHVLVRSVGRGAAAILELLARLLLLLLALLLPWSPSMRSAAMQRIRAEFLKAAERLNRLSWLPLLESADDGDVEEEASSPRDSPHVVVVGDEGVGKSTLIRALRSLALPFGVQLVAQEGLPLPSRSAGPSDVQVRVALIVWEAALEQPLASYVAEYAQSLNGLLREGSRPVVMVAVCNKTDLMPCPLPQIEDLHKSLPFIAVSVERGTNVRLLWEQMVMPHLCYGEGHNSPPSVAAPSSGPAGAAPEGEQMSAAGGEPVPKPKTFGTPEGGRFGCGRRPSARASAACASAKERIDSRIDSRGEVGETTIARGGCQRGTRRSPAEAGAGIVGGAGIAGMTGGAGGAVRWPREASSPHGVG